GRPSPPRARASSSTRSGFAAARRGRRPGRAPGSPCRGAPRRARARGAVRGPRTRSRRGSGRTPPRSCLRRPTRPSSARPRARAPPGARARRRRRARAREPAPRQPARPRAPRTRRSRRAARSTGPRRRRERRRGARRRRRESPARRAWRPASRADASTGLRVRPLPYTGLTAVSLGFHVRPRHSPAAPSKATGRVHRTRTDDRRPDGARSPFLVTHPPRNIVRNLLLLAMLVAGFALLAASVGAGSAAAKSTPPCWKSLINDWYDGRIDRTYPIQCYRDALKHLPTDVETYSSARDDIKQALQKRITQGRKGGSTTTGGGPSSSGPGSGP